MPRALPAGAQCWSPFSPDSRALPSSSGRAFIAGAFGTGHRSPPAGRGAKHRSSGPDGSLSRDPRRADPGARRPDAAQGGQDCERPEEGDRVAEDAGEPISAAASRGSDGRLRLHVAGGENSALATSGGDRIEASVRQCGKARHLRQRMAKRSRVGWSIELARLADEEQPLRRNPPLHRTEFER